MRVRNLVSLTALVAVAGLALSYLAVLGIRPGPPGQRTVLTMTVGDANGLVAGSSVLLRGIPVGKVTALQPSAAGADITFYIDGDTTVPVDTDVRLDNLSALGETYIGLFPRSGGGAAVHSGQHLDTEKVTQPPSVAQLSASVVHLLNQVDPRQLADIVSEADRALPETQAVLPNLSRASALLASAVSSRPGQGKQILANFQSLLQNADFVGPDIAAAGPDIARVGPAYQALLVAAFRLLRQTGAPESIRDFGVYLGRIQKFLDQAAPDIKTLSETLLPNVTRISAAARGIDTSQLLDGALAAVPANGAVTLHVTVPAP